MSNRLRKKLPGIIFLTSFPPKSCGIAAYSQDLIKALNNKFVGSFTTSVCAMESGEESYSYSEDVSQILNTLDPSAYADASRSINENMQIQIVMVQHEFGFFNAENEMNFLSFLNDIQKPIILTFHTVLPAPGLSLKSLVKEIARLCKLIVVMTQNSAGILARDYHVSIDKIMVIPHGIHLVIHKNKRALKHKYGLKGHSILSTFGLINSGKSIETTLDALPAIVKKHPDVLFLVIGKTHPSIIKNEGEVYRKMLENKVKELKLSMYVKFIDQYLPLKDLLEILQLTDIYLFTSKDRFQAVSGTFSYAMGCGCPIVSTPIPHAKEVLADDAGILIEFQDSTGLSEAVNRILLHDELKTTLSYNVLRKIQSSAWENVALIYGSLLKKTTPGITLQYRTPKVKLDHIRRLTTDFGIIQFCKISTPDLSSGYTLDDNALALIAVAMHYNLTRERKDISLISAYLNFIKYCQQPDGFFLNYVNINKEFTSRNEEINLEDSNGRAIWALGYLLSKRRFLPQGLIALAESMLLKVMALLSDIQSPRAIAFVIKGLYYWNIYEKSTQFSSLIDKLSQRLVRLYKQTAKPDWEWYENHLIHANSVLSEGLLCAYMVTGKLDYKDIAKKTFDFLLRETFTDKRIKLISNKSGSKKGEQSALFGEQPTDTAYTILALDVFYKFFGEVEYLQKMKIAFNWYHGENHLSRIIYNPCTGGCYDRLEEFEVNLNQGAESSVTYLMARLTWGKYKDN